MGMYKITIQNPDGTAYTFECDKVEWEHSGGVMTHPNGEPEWNGQGRMSLKAWRGCKTYDSFQASGPVCSECGRRPSPPEGGWCYECACGAESGCPLKYGNYGEKCPHEWCPNGGVAPEY